MEEFLNKRILAAFAPNIVVEGLLVKISDTAFVFSEFKLYLDHIEVPNSRSVTSMYICVPRYDHKIYVDRRCLISIHETT